MPIRLISTDFDGTLIGQPSNGRCVPELARALKAFKKRGGIWAINTGRSLAHLLEGLETFGAPVRPDYLLIHEREIHAPGPKGGWQDFGDWNATCRRRHAELFHETEGVLEQVRDALSPLPDLTFVDEGGHVAGLITSDESAMELVVQRLEEISTNWPDFAFQRNTIYLRFCHRAYHKGSSLRELSRTLKISAAEIFAIGDHFNDLSMLETDIAGSPACPANAIPEVKALVRAGGGCVASTTYGKGTAEALRSVVLTGSSGSFLQRFLPERLRAKGSPSPEEK